MLTFFLFSFLISFVYTAPILHTTLGDVQGVVSQNVKIFRGIPYAEPPIGENRLKPPKPAKKWSGVLDGTKERSVCYQSWALGFNEGSEDCLYLDVYIPENATKPLPLMIWIYGGGWQNGDKYFDGLYDARNMVNTEPHIHVAMNYRLGPFGFMSLPELVKESGSTGNYGLLDQRLAMKWAHDNAAAMGADLSRVTIYGESAGAFSICFHLVSPDSKGLFNRAILQSANCDSGDFFIPMDQAFKFSQAYLKPLGCDNAPDVLKCVRSLSASKLFSGFRGPGINKLAPALPWNVPIDKTDVGLYDIPTQEIKRGRFHNVPIIIGTDNNEGALFVLIVPSIFNIDLPFDRQKTIEVATRFWNATVAARVLDLYDHLLTYEAVIAQAITDWFFVCSSKRTAAYINSYNGSAYVYHYSFLPWWWIDDQILGDYHSSEVELTFGNAFPPVVHAFDQRVSKMSLQMRKYWISMAAHGHPNAFNGKDMPQWPKYTAKTRQDARLDAPILIESDYRQPYCSALWDHVAPQI